MSQPEPSGIGRPINQLGGLSSFSSPFDPAPREQCSWEGLPQLRGCLDNLCAGEKELELSGWSLAPCQATHTAVCLEGKLLDCQPFAEWTKSPFPAYADWNWVRFVYRIPWTETTRFARLDILLGQPGQWEGRFATTVGRLPRLSERPPPPHLMQRVTGCRNSLLFVLDGLASLRGVLTGLERAQASQPAQPRQLRRILDWGCGCGRLTAYLMEAFGQAHVYGCDIDPEAIFWANLYLQPGAFLAIEPEPPTPYPESYFDLVVGCSVCTHLDRRRQERWIAEIRRLLVPGGVALLSVHGMYAATFGMDQEGIQQLQSCGILDGWDDPALDGIAPPGYYRSVYQTECFTREAWGRYLTILSWCERAMGNFQDLVVLTKPAAL